MKTVAVVFGSRSAEHDVSIVTALASVIKPLELTGKYKVVPVYIAKDGSWYSEGKLSDINFFTDGDVDEKLSKFKKLNIKFDDGLWLLKSGLGGQKTKIDIVFPATHGTYGEDGSLMGLLNMADVPYVGCDLAASALAMDKATTKLIAEAHNIKTPKMAFCSKHEFESSPDKFIKTVTAKLSYPVFVKPAHLGSSIAITRAEDEKALKLALEVAFHYDDKTIVEEEVHNLVEVTVPVMGNDNPRVAMVEESLWKGAGFFDFDTKYMQGGKKGKGGKAGDGYSKIPAEISEELYKVCEETALAAFKALGCTGIARVDLMIDKKDKKVYLLEVNPLPGDLYKHNWQKAGVSAVELVSQLVDLGVERYEKHKKLNTVFKTNYLKQF